MEDGELVPLPLCDTIERVRTAAQASEARARTTRRKPAPAPPPSTARDDGSFMLSDALVPEVLGEDHGEVGYAARLFAQLSLPYRNPGSVPVWTRRNGTLVLQVKGTAVLDGDGMPTGEVAYPYGVLPRVLVTWMATEAVRTKDRVLVLGGSLSSFLHALALRPTGGVKGDIGRLREQMNRTLLATLVVYDRGPTADRGGTFTFADSYELWWSHAHPAAEPLWQSTLTLSERFFESIIAAPVPVDLGALRALRGSALRLDIYTWLTYRLSYLRKPTTVPWEALNFQFGGDYKHLRQFKAKFLHQLAAVRVVYPEANVEPAAGGLVLRPSPPHVPRRRIRRGSTT